MQKHAGRPAAPETPDRSQRVARAEVAGRKPDAEPREGHDADAEPREPGDSAERTDRAGRAPEAPPGRPRAEPPETARRPVPGVKHEPEPDAENIMPAEDEPGTL
jgi:hypothetical protein